MAKSTNIEFNLLNPDTINRLIEDDKIEVPNKKVDIPKDERWNEKQMMSRILQGLLNGDDMQTMSNSMTAVVGNNVNSAIRNTRTMVTSAENRGRLDSYENLSEQGLVMKKKWIATPDERTRASHLAIDGELQDLDKPFSNKCRFPADAHGPAEEVWMCRCTMGTKVIGYRRADGSISYVGNGRTTSIHDMQMADERARRATSTPVVTQSYSDKIKTIAEKVSADGLTSENVMEAGRIFAEQLNADILERQNFIDQAKHRLDEAGQAQLDAMSHDERYSEARRVIRYEDEHIRWGGTRLNDSAYWKDSTIDEVRAYVAEQDNIRQEIIDSEVYQQALEAHREARRQLHNIHNTSQMLFDRLSEVRDMGAEGLDLRAHLSNSRSPMRKVIEEAYSHYPTSWVEASIQAGTLTPKTEDRGYYSHSRSIIAISGRGDSALPTAYHELGHRFERTVDGILDQEREFYERRTAGETLEWLGSGYRRDELTRRDDFIDEYMGKDYGGSCYELVSMGFEYAYSDPVELARDPEMQAWIYGLLCIAP